MITALIRTKVKKVGENIEIKSNDGEIYKFKRNLNANNLKEIRQIYSLLDINKNKLTKKAELVFNLEDNYFFNIDNEEKKSGVSTKSAQEKEPSHLFDYEIEAILDPEKNVYSILKFNPEILENNIWSLAKLLKSYDDFNEKSDKEILLDFCFNINFIQDNFLLKLKQKIFQHRELLLQKLNENNENFNKVFNWIIDRYLNHSSIFTSEGEILNDKISSVLTINYNE